MKYGFVINSAVWLATTMLANNIIDAITSLGVSFYFLALYAIEVYKEEQKKK